jgi:hypothetical protein
MTDLTKLAGSQKHGSSHGMGELIAVAAAIFLLIAVQGMYIATLNEAAEPAPFGIIAP